VGIVDKNGFGGREMPPSNIPLAGLSLEISLKYLIKSKDKLLISLYYIDM
jgi:hypothetical protein